MNFESTFYTWTKERYKVTFKYLDCGIVEKCDMIIFQDLMAWEKARHISSSPTSIFFRDLQLGL